MAKNDITVDQFVESRVLPDLRPVVEMLRKVMREEAPNAKEVMSYGVPMYRVKRTIAVISPTKKDITIAFSRGAAFQDKYGLLVGVGHRSKNLKIKDIKGINRLALRYYIKQALELDSGQS